MNNRRNRCRVAPKAVAIAAPAIPQNCPKCNASSGIMSKHFLADNGVLGHGHGRNGNDYYQLHRADAGGG